MAEIPLTIRATAETDEAVEGMEELSDSVKELAEKSEDATEATESLTAATEEGASANADSAASLQEAGQGLQSLNRLAGQAKLAYTVFSSKINEQNESMIQSLRRVAAEAATTAGAIVSAAVRARLAAHGVLTPGAVRGGIEENKSVTGESEFQRIRELQAQAEADEWERTHRRRGGGRSGPSEEERARLASEREARSIALDAQLEGLKAQEQANQDHSRFEQSFRRQQENLVQRHNDRMHDIDQKAAADRRALLADQAAIEEEFLARRREALMADAQAAGGLAMQGAELLGFGEAEKLIVLGISEAVQAAAHLAAEDYWGAATHALASGIAFKGAADVSSRASNAGNAGASSSRAPSGGRGGAGAGAAFASTSGGGSGGGGGGTVIYQYNFGGTLAGRRDIDDFIHQANMRNVNRGRRAA